MSEENTTVVRRKRDGTLVQVLPDGSEQLLPPSDWSRFDALTDEEVEAAALADPDARPWTEEDFAKARPVPRVKILRRALGLSMEDFAARYQIPLGTLHDWEEGRAEPDQPARSYLEAIAGDPEGVMRALSRGPRFPPPRVGQRMPDEDAATLVRQMRDEWER